MGKDYAVIGESFRNYWSVALETGAVFRIISNSGNESTEDGCNITNSITKMFSTVVLDF